MKLTKATDLATDWDMTIDELKLRVRRYGWPVVKLSRTDWRFTDQQIEQIVSMQSRAAKPSKRAPKASDGDLKPTARSAKRPS